MPNERHDATRCISFRMPTEHAEVLDQTVAERRERQPWVTRADVLREIVVGGLEALEAAPVKK